jgi:hypothetical protein
MPSWCSLAPRAWWSSAGGEFQGLLVTAQGGVEMLQEHRLILARCPGVSEAFKGNRAEAAEGRGPVVPVGVRDQVARHKGQICMTATSRPSTEFPPDNGGYGRILRQRLEHALCSASGMLR